MTNKEAAELLNDIADRRLIIHVDGETKTMKQDYIDEALRLAINALDIPNETVVCSVCGAVSIKYRKGTCVNKPLIGSPVMWDYMDCSNCGCQILLNRRYIDIDDLSVRSDNTED